MSKGSANRREEGREALTSKVRSLLELREEHLLAGIVGFRDQRSPTLNDIKAVTHIADKVGKIAQAMRGR